MRKADRSGLSARLSHSIRGAARPAAIPGGGVYRAFAGGGAASVS
jgi:hypothetical protein